MKTLLHRTLPLPKMKRQAVALAATGLREGEREKSCRDSGDAGNEKG